LLVSVGLLLLLLKVQVSRDLMGDVQKRTEQFLIRFLDLTFEELHHPVYFTSDQDRKRDRPMQIVLRCRCCSREIGIFGHVRYPLRACAGPRAARQPDSPGERTVRTGSLKVWYRHERRMAEHCQTEHVGLLVADPVLAHTPVKMFAQGEENARQRSRQL